MIFVNVAFEFHGNDAKRDMGKIKCSSAVAYT